MILLIITPLSAGGACLDCSLFISGNNLNHQYPKLANLFFRWDITEAEAKALAKWDILIIDMEVQTYTPQSLKLLKELNPNIKLLAYIASQEIRGDSGGLNGTLRQRLFQQIAGSWWLKDVNRKQVSWWPANPMVNVTLSAPLADNARWIDVLPQFVQTELMNSGYWDGVFFDNVWDDISFLNEFNIDLNQDGKAESPSELTEKWKQGMKELLFNTRNSVGSDKLIFGNGGDYYYQYLNGVLYEHFPEKGWSAMMAKYRFIDDNAVPPAAGILNVNVDNTYKKDDYKKMRFGLASALLDDGYYSFDNGDETHREIWWYDEYETGLGAPAGEAFDVLSGAKKFSDGVWRRDFKNGLVILNNTDKKYLVDLDGEYEKIHGTQDAGTNDGLFVSAAEVPAKDGLLLLRPIEKILNAVYVNGSFARVFNRFGHVSRSGFFAYKDEYKGGSQIIEYDLNNDGQREVLVADVNQVKIFNNDGSLSASFYPYTEKYDKGVNIAVGDLDKNGTVEIVTGTEKGGGPQIRIFNSNGKLINPGFFAYGTNFRGGVNVAIGDLEGDGTLEIIAGAGFGGGPHVRVFAPDGRLINPGFFAYDPKFRGGVNVAVADVDGDGLDEIITGPGQGGGPEVRVYDKKGKKDGPSFFAFDEQSRDGVRVSGVDMDADGQAEIIATTTNVFTLAGMGKQENRK
ncbi:VCBS repeat-containing protein [Candidatus Falkowbacteria bacterium]|nr:VCBS repeat-containing protein [Candidatus Falkowbacteria bacterium]